jgi:hypothetical protein
MAHDLMDPPPPGYDWREQGWDCTSFASYVLWEGGIRDWRKSPERDEATGYYVDYPDTEVSYWNGDWAQSPTPNYTYPGITFHSWMRTPDLYRFLTMEMHFQSYSIRNDRRLGERLLDIPFDLGDLVFYGPASNFSHVAVIVREWGSQTYFEGFPPCEDCEGTITWTEYWESNQYQDVAEDRVALTRDALVYYRASRCQEVDLPDVPRVVERSGSILYYGSRSINNTLERYPSLTIVHIEESGGKR